LAYRASVGFFGTFVLARSGGLLANEDAVLGSARPGPGQVVGWLTGPDLAARLAARRGTLPGPEAEAALEAALRALDDLQS
jgi:hypothetical protein